MLPWVKRVATVLVLALVCCLVKFGSAPVPEPAEPTPVTYVPPPPAPERPKSLLEVGNEVPSYIVSGSPTPDCTGCFFEGGTYNGEPYYSGGGFHLWWDEVGTWFISDILGSTSGAGYWEGDATILGVYSEGSQGDGDVTVTSGGQSDPTGAAPASPRSQSTTSRTSATTAPASSSPSGGSP
jgi:hypothetical protein